jgi:hypothetical protein
MGGVELRVVKVTDNSCTQVENLPGPDPAACYAPFNTNAAFTGILTLNGTEYDFGSIATSELRGRFGEVRMMKEVNYGKKGFRIVLPAGDFNEASRVMQQICNDGLFADPSIRAISATINVYNTNTRFVTVMRLTVEVLQSAYLIPSSILFTVPVPELFVTNTKDKVLIAVLAAYIVGWLYYLQKETRRFYYRRPRLVYCLQPQNIFEIALQICSGTFLFMYLVYVIQGLGPVYVDVNNPAFVDMFDFAWHFTDTFLWAGLTGLLSSLKMFRFLSINKRMDTLWLTLYRAKYDLLAFSIGLCVCLVAFAFFGNQAFGYRLRDYKDYATSSATLMQYILGMFSYTELADARPYIAWSFFGLYVCVVNIVFINLIIAIVSKYFQEVHEEVNRVDKWKTSTSRLEQEVMSEVARALKKLWRALKLNFCCCCFARGKAMLAKWELCWCKIRKRFLTRANRINKLTGDVPSDDLVDQEEKKEATEREIESSFWKEMRNMARSAERVNHIDLFVYFERLYEDTTGSDYLYVGVDELCSLIRARPCRFRTSHTDCEARTLIEAFKRLKVC